MKTFAKKDENIHKVEEICESELSDENEYVTSEESMYYTSTETDESENSVGDELSDDLDLTIEEPDSMSFQDSLEVDDIENDEVLEDVEIEDKATVLGSSENETFTTKFKSYQDSLHRLRSKYGFSSSTKNINQDQGEKKIKTDGTSHLNTFWLKPRIPSYNLESPKQGFSSSPVKNFEKHQIMAEVHSNLSMESPISIAELFSDTFGHSDDKSDSLSKDGDSLESTKFCVNDLKATEPSIIDIRSQEKLPHHQIMEKEISYDPKETANEEANKDVNPTKFPSPEFHTIPSTDSKWATGDSIHSGNSPEKLSSNEYAENGKNSVTKQVKSLRQRLNKLGHMFDEMEKVMVCENCLNMSKSEGNDISLVEKKTTKVSDTVASGETFHTGYIQNSFQGTSKNRFGSFDYVNKNQQLPPGLINGDNYNLTPEVPNFQHSTGEFDTSFDMEANNDIPGKHYFKFKLFNLMTNSLNVLY